MEEKTYKIENMAKTYEPPLLSDIRKKKWDVIPSGRNRLQEISRLKKYSRN